MLLDGVAALREDRFAFRAAPPSSARTWATVYVRRGLWFARAAAVAAVVAVGWFGYHAAVVAPQEALVRGLTAHHAAIAEVARDADARQQAADWLASGRAAIAAGATGDARQALEALEALRTRLEQAYELRIVVGDRVASGVWRVPDTNSRVRNYYLIVEAVDAAGRRLTLPILDEETGRVERASTWGLRVDQATWERVADDKADDGIIQQRLVGRKSVGELDPTFAVASTGGAITRW